MKTKWLLFTLLGILIGQQSFAQTPEKVHSIVKVFKTYEWYAEQNVLWEKEVKKNKRNADAWENVYASARMAKIMSPTDEERNEWLEKMGSVITRIEKAIPNSYEYYHIKSWDSSIWASSEKGVKTISEWAEKAFAMDPTRTEIYPDMMNVAMIEGDLEKTKKISQYWMKSGEISPNLMALSYNMLMSTEKNALLITTGDNDTYPALVLQYGKDIRPDVTVINMYCAWGSEVYRNRLLKKHGIEPLLGDVSGPKDVIKHILKNGGDTPIYFAYGDDIVNDEGLEKNLYNVGLAIRYSEDDYNNTSVLLNNFETKFLLNHLKVQFFEEEFPEQVKRHNLCYLPGLMILYKHYAIVDNEKKRLETKQFIEDIVKGTSYEEQVQNQFSSEKS